MEDYLDKDYWLNTNYMYVHINRVGIKNVLIQSQHSKEDFIECLSRMLEHYELLEEYEKCHNVVDWLKNIN